MLNERDGREVMACLVSGKKAPSSLSQEANKRSFLRVLELCKHPCLTQVRTSTAPYLLGCTYPVPRDR